MKRKCIVVEADKKTIQNVRETVRRYFDVLDAPDSDQAMRLLDTHSDVSVFITQHGTGQLDCINLLERVRAAHPAVRRVVMTSYLELNRIIHGLHSGTIQQLVQKPINGPELMRAIVPFEAQTASIEPYPHKRAG